MNAATSRSAALRGLYLLTPDEPDTEVLVARVSSVLGEACLLQYRNKAADAGLRCRQAEALLPLCQAAGVPLVVNDDAVLAARVAAAGVHLGEDDGDIDGARALLGARALVGVSCYDDLDRARQAARLGADYLALGAFFPSATKPHARKAGLSLLQAASTFGKPMVAIGGITPDNARTLVEAGADMVAVISGVFDAPDPLAAARAYRRCFD